jgi:hypothetical protein
MQLLFLPIALIFLLFIFYPINAIVSILFSVLIGGSTLYFGRNNGTFLTIHALTAFVWFPVLLIIGFFLGFLL